MHFKAITGLKTAAENERKQTVMTLAAFEQVLGVDM